MFVRGGAPCGFRVWDFWGWGCTLHSALGATGLQKAPPLIDTRAGNASENDLHEIDSQDAKKTQSASVWNGNFITV